MIPCCLVHDPVLSCAFCSLLDCWSCHEGHVSRTIRSPPAADERRVTEKVSFSCLAKRMALIVCARLGSSSAGVSAFDLVFGLELNEVNHGYLGC